MTDGDRGRRAAPAPTAGVTDSPADHHRGALAVVGRFARLAGLPAPPEEALALLGDPAALPRDPPHSERGLKYDASWTAGPTGSSWGLTVSDRYEGPALADRAGRIVRGLPGGHRWGAARDLLGAPFGPRPSGVVGLGWGGGGPPRVKVYVQEERWAEGVGPASRVRAVLADTSPATPWPGWIDPSRPIGVVALDLRPEGEVRWKLYLSGPTPSAAAAGAGPEALALAARLEGTCPHRDEWYYLTVRLHPGGAHRVALNKVYNPTALAFSQGGTLAPLGWDDARRLFRSAGREEDLVRLRAELEGIPGVRAVPTATAVEDGGRSVDVYVTAWAGIGEGAE